ncbi:MAG: hypothetical protein ABIV47_13790 [Roseiflexaceae bacterium]
MARRSIFASILVILAMLALAVPALAGGWALVSLDSLPRELRADETFQLGFTVLQHGKTPTNKDLNGNPLTPVLKATKQGGAATTQTKDAATIRVEARQQGPAGHYLVDLAFPSDGTWAWQIEVPTYFVQDSPSGQNSAIFAPLTVLPAAAPATASAPAPAPAATSWLGLSPAALRWAGLAVLLAALAIGLYAQRGIVSRRTARPQ